MNGRRVGPEAFTVMFTSTGGYWGGGGGGRRPSARSTVAPGRGGTTREISLASVSANAAPSAMGTPRVGWGPAPPTCTLAEPWSPATTLTVEGGVGSPVRVKSPVVVIVNGRLSVPSEVVTVRGPVVAPGGTVVVMVVAVIV